MEQNNDKKDKQDVINKSLYNYIGYHYIQNINNNIETNMKNIDGLEIPKSLDNWFLKFNRDFENKGSNNKYKSSFKKIISKVAVIFLMLGISVTILTITTDANRARFLSIVSRKGPKYLDIKVVDDTEESVPNIKVKKYYLPEYTPDGFEIDSINDLDKTKIIIYINQNDEEIVFNQGPNGTNFRIDSEKAKMKDIDINGKGGIIISKEEITTLFWYNEEYSFYISSTIEQEELVLMAKSLIKK